MKTGLWVASAACLLCVITAKPRDGGRLQEDAPVGVEREELAYTYHSRTTVIGQKDFEIAAKVSMPV